MKKIYFICIVLVLVLTGCEIHFESSWGPHITTVARARNLREGTQVRMEGTIESVIVIGNDRFRFTDETGSIAVEIEPEVWRRSGINLVTLEFPLDVSITGLTSRGVTGREVHVSSIREIRNRGL